MGERIWTERFGGSATKSSEQSEQFGAGASDLACVARRAGGPLLFVCFAVPYFLLTYIVVSVRIYLLMEVVRLAPE